MTAARRSAEIAAVEFDRRKYGTALDVDAAEVRALAGFITAPRPHRLRFYELVLLRQGAGSIDIDGHSHALRGGLVLCSRPDEVRCWRLDAALDGITVCFTPEFFGTFFADAGFVDRLPFFAPIPRLAAVALAPASFASLETIALAMQRELRRHRADSGHWLRAQAYQLLLALARAVPAESAAPSPRALAQRFGALVERQFRRETRVATYARALGVTPGHLNASVQEAFGRSAGELLRARRLLEARRLLLYAATPVRDIAAALGFRDPSYFVRFFRRTTGSTPDAFRRSFGQQHHEIGGK